MCTDDVGDGNSYFRRVGNQEAPLDERIQELLALTARAAGAYGRTDLADKLENLAPRLAPTTAKVLVAGEFKAGKSSLVNALIGADVCPVDDDVATSVLTVVGAASSPWRGGGVRRRRCDRIRGDRAE